MTSRVRGRPSGVLSRIGDVMVIAVAFASLIALLRGRRDPTAASVPVGQSPTFVEDWRDIESLGADQDAPRAAVHLVEFIDYECPGCAILHDIVVSLKERYRDTVSVSTVHFPLRQHRSAVAAANAAECARDQGRFREMNSRLYRDQASVAQRAFWRIARDAGVEDSARFTQCAQANDTAPSVIAGIDVASRLRLPGTPALLIDGWLYSAVPTQDVLRSIIERSLAERRLR